MELAARRPHISAGVALASAAVIAAAPMAQHLPKLDLAQHLPTVSVTDINLTDAASGMMDLFSGVENQLASLANGASAAAVPAAALTDFINPAALPLPAATWVNTFQNAGTNLQWLLNTWSQLPFPVAQQVAANLVSYASAYVGDYQASAAALVKYLGPSGAIPGLESAWSQILSGNITGGVSGLFTSGYLNFSTQVLFPLEKILQIPTSPLTNLANFYSYLSTTGVTLLLAYPLATAPQQIIVSGVGPALQNIYNAWQAGDPVGVLTQLANAPGLIANAFLNGTPVSKITPPVGGLLGSPAFVTHVGQATLKGSGFLSAVETSFLPGLAEKIVAPNAQNIANGGSLATALQDFGNQLIGGWPSTSAVSTALSYFGSQLSTGLQGAISSGFSSLGSQLTSLLQNLPSTLASLPSMLGSFASQIGSLLINLLRLL